MLIPEFSFHHKLTKRQLKKLLKFKRVKPKLYDVYGVDENNNVQKIGTTTLELSFEEQKMVSNSVKIKISYDPKRKENNTE